MYRLESLSSLDQYQIPAATAEADGNVPCKVPSTVSEAMDLSGPEVNAQLPMTVTITLTTVLWPRTAR